MKEYTDKINITINHNNRLGIEAQAEKNKRSRSKMIDIAVGEYLDRIDPNRKMKQILNKRNGKK